MMNRKQRLGRGFTFLEIMFVVVIIGILLALVGPRLLGRSEQARETASKTQLKGIENAIKNYEMEVGKLPKNLEDLIEDPGDNPSWNGPYLDSDVVPKDAWSQEFLYKVPGEHNQRSFDLWSPGSDGQEGTEDDIANWTKNRS